MRERHLLKWERASFHWDCGLLISERALSYREHGLLISEKAFLISEKPSPKWERAFSH
jgi:hypothetical protein